MTEQIQILFVDDEPGLLDIGKIYLEDFGDFLVTTVESAEDAIQILSRLKFDAIIADYDMNDMNGIELLTHLRSSGDTTPYIVFTGKGREEVVIEALNNGADFYIQKGSDPQAQFTELAHKVRYAVSQRRVEKELSESLKRTAEIINFLPDATFAIDEYGVVIAWNRAMEEMTGISKDDMIGQGDHAYTVPFYGERRQQLLDLIDMDDEKISSKYLSIQRKGHTLYAEVFTPALYEGKGAYVMATGAPLFDLHGNRVGAIESIRDITEQKKAEEAIRETNAYLGNLISIANVPIIIWDPSFRITRMNHAFELLIGRPATEVVGNSLEFLFPPAEVDRSMRLFKTTLEGVRWETVEIDILHRDGTVRTVLWNSSTLYTQDGITPVSTIAQGQDITDKQRLEQEKDAALVQIQRNLAQLAILNDGIRNPLTIILCYVEDMQDDIQVTGTIKEQIRQIDKVIDQVDQRWNESEKILKYLRKHYQIDLISSSEQDKIKETGDDQSGAHGGIIRVPGRRNEILIEEVQAQLYTILDSIDALVYVTDMDTYDLLYVNQHGRNIFGGITGQKCYQSIQKDQDGPCSFCTSYLLTDQFGPTGVYHWEYQNTKNGRWYDCRDRAIRWSDGRLVRLEIATDITERKQSERTLWESEQKFRSLIEYALEGIMILDLQGNILFANNATACTVEADVCAGLIGRNVMEFIAPESQEDAVNDFIQVSKGHDAYLAHYNAISAKGKKFSLESIGKVIKYEGKPAVLISVRDITEQKKVGEALLESEERFCDLITITDDIIWQTDEQARFVYVSPQIEGILGYKPEELIGRKPIDFLETASVKVYKESFLAAVISPQNIVLNELYWLHKNGRRLILESRAKPIFLADGSYAGYRGIHRDVTVRRQAEEALRESNKKLRLLTGLTRHDISNQLTVVHTSLDLAMDESNPAITHEYISHAQEASERIETIIGFTQTYENFGTVSSGWQRIYPVITSAKAEVRLGKISIDNQIPGDLTVYTYPIIRKVFSTLIENAIRHGGDITIIRFFCSERDGTLIITCEDDGVGILTDEKAHIFDHGYGKNTGIGLFLASEILSITGLSIQECGVAKEGARFEILVPVGKYRYLLREEDREECRTQ